MQSLGLPLFKNVHRWHRIQVGPVLFGTDIPETYVSGGVACYALQEDIRSSGYTEIAFSVGIDLHK